MRLGVTNPMNRALRALLAFEAVCFGLAIPGMIQVSGVPLGSAFALGAAAAVLALAASGTLKRDVGWWLAWLTQLIGVALGLATAMMYGVGGMFALLWVTAFVLGRRLEPRSSKPV